MAFNLWQIHSLQAAGGHSLLIKKAVSTITSFLPVKASSKRNRHNVGLKKRSRSRSDGSVWPDKAADGSKHPKFTFDPSNQLCGQAEDAPSLWS